MQPIKICGIDPGIVNMSAWIGTYFPETCTVKTTVLCKCACGISLADGVPQNVSEPKDAGKLKSDPVPKKQSLQAMSADSAIGMADVCLRENVDAVVVETAPQWNVPIRISAATIYGVLRGKGVRGVKFSSSSTKSNAIKLFSEKFGMLDQMEAPPEGDKKDKKVSAKVRLINKRNAVRVAAELLKRSEDVVGLEAFKSDTKKQDDMSDAILLGCGTAFGVQTQREKDLKKALHKKK
jgi:hypothetical protein